jgi:hypothetical protein
MRCWRCCTGWASGGGSNQHRLTEMQQFMEPFIEPTPGIRVRHFANAGPFRQRIRSSSVIDLSEAEQRFQPRTLTYFQRSADQSCHEIHLRPVQNGSLDFDDRADRNRT